MALGREVVGVIGIAALAPLSQRTEESLASIARALALGIRRTALEVSRRRLADILEAAADFVTIGQTTGPPLYMNAAARRALEIGETEQVAELFTHRPAGFDTTFRDTILPALERDGVWSGETEYLSRSGRIIPVSQVSVAHRDDSGRLSFLSTISRDITDRRALEEELRQAQKMEGIGQLAGGIAHDFNNLLTAILGYAELLAGSLPASDLRRRDVDEIKKAGTRAAALTRQLLAFSRKQILAPRVVQVSTVVGDVMPMLRRLIGESVDLKTVFHERGLVKVDAGQLGQVLVNLAVNARDAMPDGGQLTIETADVEVDADHTEPHAGVPAGRFVKLAVSDTGHGMDDATKRRVFDPFFTTKPLGQGTGLGLATVHGIVKQSGGHVWFSSEVGHGSTFTVLLPRTADTEDRHPTPELTLPMPNGSGTVLVVEDESLIRSFVEKVLTTHGFVVHAFGAPSGALAFATSHRQPIHVVLTDVILPEMNGRALSQRLLEAHPEASVVYMSGYTDTAIVHRGVLDAGTRFLQKPFTARSLLERIGEVSPASLAEPADGASTVRASTY
jgi:PAS domain S-box-containing protein